MMYFDLHLNEEPQKFMEKYRGEPIVKFNKTRGHSKEMHTHAKEAEVSPGKVW